MAEHFKNEMVYKLPNRQIYSSRVPVRDPIWGIPYMYEPLVTGKMRTAEHSVGKHVYVDRTLARTTTLTKTLTLTITLTLKERKGRKGTRTLTL